MYSALLLAMLLHGLILLYFSIMPGDVRDNSLELFEVTVAEEAPPPTAPQQKPIPQPDIPTPGPMMGDPDKAPGPAPSIADMPLNDRPPAPLKMDMNRYRRLPATGTPNPTQVEMRNRPGASETGNPLGVPGGSGDQEGSGSGGSGGGGGQGGWGTGGGGGSSENLNRGWIFWEWGEMDWGRPINGIMPPRQDAVPIHYDISTRLYDGRVWVNLTIGADGRVVNATVTQSSGDSELDHLALRKAHEGTWFPATRDGQPIEFTINIAIRFY